MIFMAAHSACSTGCAVARRILVYLLSDLDRCGGSRARYPSQNTRMGFGSKLPSNPLLKTLIDLEAIAKISRREHKIISVCDNTFATPWIQPARSRTDSTSSCILRPKYLKRSFSDLVSGVSWVGDNKGARRSNRIPCQKLRSAQLPARSTVFLVPAEFENSGTSGWKGHWRECARDCAGGLEEQREVKFVRYPRTKIPSAPHDLARQTNARLRRNRNNRLERRSSRPPGVFLENTQLFALAEKFWVVSKALFQSPRRL